MKRIAAVLLKLPNDCYVMQRRDSNAPTSANLLTFFGGHIEDSESAVIAAKRELQEETSINTDDLVFNHILSLEIPSSDDPSVVSVYYDLFSVDIESMDFKVYEGSGAEAYTFDDLAVRNDLSFTAKHAIGKIISNSL